MWDFTSADTGCPTYVRSTCRQAGETARTKETATLKYVCLQENFIFCPIVIETFGQWGEEGRKLIDIIGRKLQETTGDRKAKSYLIERFSIVKQRRMRLPYFI